MEMIREGVVFSFGYFTVQPGKEERFLEKWQQFSQWTLNHAKGVRWMYMVRDQEDPPQFLSFGPWDSLKSVAAWMQSPKFKAAHAELEALCSRVEYSTMTEVTHVKR